MHIRIHISEMLRSLKFRRELETFQIGLSWREGRSGNQEHVRHASQQQRTSVSAQTRVQRLEDFFALVPHSWLRDSQYFVYVHCRKKKIATFRNQKTGRLPTVTQKVKSQRE